VGIDIRGHEYRAVFFESLSLPRLKKYGEIFMLTDEIFCTHSHGQTHRPLQNITSFTEELKYVAFFDALYIAMLSF